MKQITLYKLDNSNRTREWSIEVDQYDDFSSIKISSGLSNGKKVPQVIPIHEGKSIGRSNETTHYTQAVSEAKAKIELQLRSGYVYNIDDIKQNGVLGSGIPAPMLAQKYHPTGEQKVSKTLDKMKIKGDIIHVQPKLDGNRCLIKVTQNNIVMYTRKGDIMPVQLTHILDEVKFCYDKSGVTKEIILDGELCSTNEMSFNELNGHLKRKDKQDIEQLVKIKYHLYDCMEDVPYDDRYQNIVNFISKAAEFGKKIKFIEVIPSYELVATDENINAYLEKFLEEGNEGLMIRTLDSGYEHKRSWQLCKVKIFEASEFKLLDMEVDSMGRLGKFIMKMSKDSVDRDGKIITTFKAGTTGMSHEEGYGILKNKDQYLGSMCTIEYFGVSEYGVPRFPKMKELNRIDY